MNRPQRNLLFWTVVLALFLIQLYLEMRQGEVHWQDNHFGSDALPSPRSFQMAKAVTVQYPIEEQRGNHVERYPIF
ncbi:hypothetical protein [Oscillibacter sp. PC13]|uniref:hypothetical protein n=1 Tax=Oscillibacter sp. PC13 TaxID=1855299 RepID=UPI0011608415|nr:hypothetical protein [Oscillibacter sp. PC13]